MFRTRRSRGTRTRISAAGSSQVTLSIDFKVYGFVFWFCNDFRVYGFVYGFVSILVFMGLFFGFATILGFMALCMVLCRY